MSVAEADRDVCAVDVPIDEIQTAVAVQVGRGHLWEAVPHGSHQEGGQHARRSEAEDHTWADQLAASVFVEVCDGLDGESEYRDRERLPRREVPLAVTP